MIAVVGLHAATDSTRSGPYSDLRWTVDRYDAAARKFLNRPGAELPWGKRVEFPGVMDLIEVEALTAQEDMDYFRICKELYVSPDLMSFKLFSMIQRGYQYNLPQGLNSTFLKN